MKKRIVSLFILMSLFLSISYPAFAQVQSSGYAKYSFGKNITFTEENVNKCEKRQMNYSQYENGPAYSLNANGMDIQPFGQDPGQGAYNLIYTPIFNTGNTYADTSKSSTIISTILDLTYTIASYFFTTGMSIVTDVATFVYGMSSPEVALSSAGKINLSHSYSYVSKLGQVYIGSYWETKVDIEKRMWFRHEYASWSTTSGYTRTGTWDFTPDNGYGPIQTEYKPYYNDDNWIYNQTMYRYNNYLPTYVSAWTH